MKEKNLETRTEPGLQRRFYSVKEAANFLGVAPQTIYNATSRRSSKELPIPFKRLGSKILFDIRDLEKF